MASIFSISEARLAKMSRKALKVWIETVVTRLGIPISESTEGSSQYDAEVILAGDYEHVSISYDRGSYAVWSYSPYIDYANIIDGKGELEVEIQRARDLTDPSNPQNK
ncbi:hypothetical protein UFOVP549_9 [uncultured Caudovirales phage]|uniref:Uncharacterized protein n=1 Tax=uncultured Caudovirales phage TaxID=2100421 RepID=A0A6J5N1M3_9CAUD|nr:hypothetical protein UFOVP549_9 [uncultured Caudovirales phage]